jgi:hypothetical protein
MKNVNPILLETIYNLLVPVVACPVYYKYLPATISSNIDISLNAVSHTDVSTQSTSDTETSVVIGIYSEERQGNPGQLVNDVATIVYDTIYPNRTAVLTIPGFQNVSITMVNDIEQDALIAQGFVSINRFITFRFNIYHAA